MIVPFDKSQSSPSPIGRPKPSETDLLLALGAMHSAGRFAQKAPEIAKLGDQKE